MVAKILWEIGSAIPFLIGIIHLTGALFTNLLHPTNKQLIEDMKVSPIEVDPKALIWKTWIGFNATFGICLAFMGFINFYLAYMHFELLQGFSVISIATIVSTILLSWISYKYLINRVVRVFLISTIFYTVSAILSI